MQASCEEEIALLLCATEAQRHREHDRLEYLVARADYEALERQLVWQRVLPLAGTRLIAAAGDAVPRSFRARIEEQLRIDRLRAVLFQAVTSPLLRQLESAGIPVIPLKGPWFAERVFGDPGLRSSNDVDLLVSPSQLEAACELLLNAGYTAGSETRWLADRPLLHEVLLPPMPDAPAIELHWRVHWYELDFAEDVVSRSIWRPPMARRPTLSDELAMLLLYLARDGLIGLRLVADVSAWWDAFGAALPSRALDSMIERYPALAPAWRTSSDYVCRLGGMPIGSLRGDESLRPSERCALGLANWRKAGGEAELVFDQKLVDLMLSSVGGRRGWARRHVWPPLEHIRRTYELESGRRGAELLHRVKHAGAITLQMLAHILARTRARISDRTDVWLGHV